MVNRAPFIATFLFVCLVLALVLSSGTKDVNAENNTARVAATPITASAAIVVERYKPSNNPIWVPLLAVGAVGMVMLLRVTGMNPRRR